MRHYLHNSLRALFLSLAVLLSLPMMAEEIDGINYEFNGETKQATVIKKSSGNYSGEIVIPESLEHESVTYSVTSIGEKAFYKCIGLTSVTIPNSVESIRDWAFYYCTGLTSVTIPNSVKSIGEYAFYYCSGLTSVTIGNSVEIIGIYAFSDCSGLTSVTIPNSVTSIGDYAFSYCIGLTSVTIPNSVTSIGNYAFCVCYRLTSVTIPNSVTSIGGSTFSGCTGLTSVTISNSVESIGDDAFSRCSGLTSVTIGNSVTSIGNSAFSYCSGLTSVIIGNSVTSIGENAFYECSGLTSVTIPNSVTSIGDYAFYDCSGLTSVHISDIAAWCNIDFDGSYSNPLKYAHHLYLNGEEVKDLVIPNTVTSIKDYAFYECSGLTSVTIGNSVESIGYRAFTQCSGLTSVTIGKSVTSIEDFAFEDCSGLTSVTIPNSVTSIGWGAFSNCPELLDVYCYAEKVPSTVSYAFDGYYIQNATLHVPAASIDSYKATEPWSSFGKIESIETTIPVSSITLSQSSATMTEGETLNLTATVTPDDTTDKSITWSSSNTSVASVDADGKVTAQTEGTATITATANDGSGVKASCVVTVEKKIVSVSSITLSQSSATMTEGETLALTATVTPDDATDKSITWSSSNTSVASVDANGKVTAKAEGTATITATANNGKEYADKLITIGTAQAEMVPGQWYFLHSSRNPNQSATDFAEVGGTPASAGGFVTDMGLGTGVKLTATSVIDEVTNPEGVNANNYMASIVRFVEVEGEEGAYNIQFGTGNWVGHHDGGNGTNIGSVNHNNYIAGNAGKYNFYLVTIDGTPNAAGRFGWNKFNMADRVDNNGADGTVVFWGDGEITGESEGYTTDDEIKGNKIWQIYDIVVVGEVDKYADALKASCVVTVEKKIVSVASITLSQSSATMTEGETLNLTATITPYDATDKSIIWSSSNEEVASVDANGNVTAKAEGTATITATANDGSGVKASCVVTVNKTILGKCATPIISYADGQVSVTCETEDAKVVTAVANVDDGTYEEIEFSLTPTYTITAYATKAQYENSDVATLTICWIACTEKHEDEEETGLINIPAKAVLIQSHQGIITLSGLDAGTEVAAYNTTGAQLATAVATDGTATLYTNLSTGSIVIVKFGNKSVKIKI